MLEAGARLDSPLSKGRSLLFVAAERGDLEAVSFLFGRGAEVDVGRGEGVRGDIRALLEHGADLDHLVDDAGTALERAQRKEHSEVIAMLEPGTTAGDNAPP